ncbi:hypothetical protein PPROV_000078800 [Pycnococcus provasolii]|uniref:Uncharacterized protein n=1 Tax=Pycnococcus provasolii TaxID=41880 RepID=A0A830H664_9CHLO|nr:hypothetical protein PPROV_000078800 [Pycnococcus provasolii]
MYAKPRGRPPAGYTVWCSSRGEWHDNNGNAKPRDKKSKQKGDGTYPKPRGPPPADYPVWCSSRGEWHDENGNAKHVRPDGDSPDGWTPWVGDFIGRVLATMPRKSNNERANAKPAIEAKTERAHDDTAHASTSKPRDKKSAKQKGDGTYPKPRGRPPKGFAVWCSSRGEWHDDNGNAKHVRPDDAADVKSLWCPSKGTVSFSTKTLPPPPGTSAGFEAPSAKKQRVAGADMDDDLEHAVILLETGPSLFTLELAGLSDLIGMKANPEHADKFAGPYKDLQGVSHERFAWMMWILSLDFSERTGMIRDPSKEEWIQRWKCDEEDEEDGSWPFTPRDAFRLFKYALYFSEKVESLDCDGFSFDPRIFPEALGYEDGCFDYHDPETHTFKYNERFRMMLAAHMKLFAFRLAFRDACPELHLPRWFTSFGEEFAIVCVSKAIASMDDEDRLLDDELYESLPEHADDMDYSDFEDRIYDWMDSDGMDSIWEVMDRKKLLLETWFAFIYQEKEASFTKFRHALTHTIVAHTNPPPSFAALLDPSSADLRAQ